MASPAFYAAIKLSGMHSKTIKSNLEKSNFPGESVQAPQEDANISNLLKSGLMLDSPIIFIV